ncbi:stage II sporulation protein M [Sphingomonas sp. HITSZ_GF]|uniref:stage II sporulation protein M n=1 Tax=Sphingomonas sp. HITSZ_GF TaxID=3037247 RepID=UPI00240E545A|nr:stage II sporulation protein M [Sphingomonas sp. HITSZ_GF]MDG2532542.1 stage II sporulation protein M [Sphingomonas sp. HITSZ_GF]
MSRGASGHFASARFREARAIDWAELEQRVIQIERGRANTLSDEDLLELPVLYRTALSSLSVARETSLDADLVGYLEALCARAYFVLYGVQPPLRRRIAAFVGASWPLALRSLWRETLIAVLMMLLGAIAAYYLVASDPAWYHSIIPGDLAGGRGPQSSAEELRKTLYDGGGDNMLGAFATYLFTHNAQVALMCFALGFAFGVPTLLLLVYQGAVLGAFFSVFASKGLGLPLAAWLTIHGTTEMFAIAIAGAAGLRIGMAVAFPGKQARTAATREAGRTATFAMIGVVLMLAVAGLLEGVGRQVIQSDVIRVAIGGIALVLWLSYFYAMPVRAADVDD